MSRIALIGKPDAVNPCCSTNLPVLDKRLPIILVSLLKYRRGCLTTMKSSTSQIYSLQTISEDERAAVEKFEAEVQSQDLNGIIIVLDGTRLQTSLLLGLQIVGRVQQSTPVLFAIKFLDTLKDNNLHIDTDGLSEALGIDVVLFSAKTTEGLDKLKTWIAEPIKKDFKDLPEDLQNLHNL